jgi:hypothetical protein
MRGCLLITNSQSHIKNRSYIHPTKLKEINQELINNGHLNASDGGRIRIISSSAAAALGGEPLREPPPVLAVVVAHVVALGPLDGAPLGGVGLLVHPPVAAGGARAAADAGVGGVAAVGDDEGGPRPVDGDLALLGGPVAAVPQRGVQRHGPGARVRQVGIALEAADDVAVDLEDDVGGVPDDGVVVVVGSRVEPQVELVLLLAVAAGPHVGVEHHRLPGAVAHELHVDLVVVVAVTGGKLQ